MVVTTKQASASARGTIVRPVETGGSVVQDLFREHYLELVRLASLWTDSTAEAEDVVQDVFAGTTLIGVSSPLPFLKVAVANRARSAARRKGTERRTVNRYASVMRPSTTAADDGLATFDRALMLAIRRLPNRQRDIIILRYYMDWSIEQTADELNISPSAVRSSGHRAVQSLKTWMTEEAK